jgi:alkylation response protein AidB-like acyl-CoA dehydrogenase
VIAGGYAGAVAASAREMLERETPRDGVLARLRGEPLSRKAWKAAAAVGWFRLLTSSAGGGMEAGPAELAALFREVGRYLLAGPFVECVVAAGLLRDHADVGPDERVVSFGAGGLVEHADVSDLLLLRVEAAGADAIAAVDPHAPGVTITPLHSFDLVGRPCLVELQDAPREVLVEGPLARALLDRIDLCSTVAAIGELAGLAAEVLDMSVAHAKERVQFERPIGAFQAVQHRLAEMAVTLAALDAGQAAAVALAEGEEPDRGVRLHALHAYAAGLARELVLSGLQVHGGIGFTDEYRLHAYLKRALRLQAVAEAQGDPLPAMGARLLAGHA